MRLINPKESKKYLEDQVTGIKISDDAIEKFIRFFKEYKIKEKLEHEEEDMMLFQYGNYDWQDGNGREFHFNLTRQFEIPGEDEFLQLKLTLFYDPERIGEIESFNSWSVDSADLEVWKKLIKETKGYRISENLRPKRFEINLSET